MVETILTRSPTEEEVKRFEAVALDWERFVILLDLCYEHYISESAKPDLSKLCILIVQISKDFKGEIPDSIPESGRHTLIGERVVKAVSYGHKVGGKKPITNKAVFQSLVAQLVDRAHRDGHPKNKTAQTQIRTAFEVTADLMYRYGIRNMGKKYSASTISNWCDEKSLNPTK